LLNDKKLADRFNYITFVETIYLNAGMCQFESS